MATQAFDKKIEKLCAEKKVSGVVFIGGDAEGKVVFFHLMIFKLTLLRRKIQV